MSNTIIQLLELSELRRVREGLRVVHLWTHREIWNESHAGVAIEFRGNIVLAQKKRCGAKPRSLGFLIFEITISVSSVTPGELFTILLGRPFITHQRCINSLGIRLIPGRRNTRLRRGVNSFHRFDSWRSVTSCEWDVSSHFCDGNSEARPHHKGESNAQTPHDAQNIASGEKTSCNGDILERRFLRKAWKVGSILKNQWMCSVYLILLLDPNIFDDLNLP